VHEDLLLERGDAADAGGDQTPRAGGRRRSGRRPVERLGGGGQGELGEAVGAAGLLRVVEVRRRIEVVDRRSPPVGRAEQARPERVDADAARRDDAEAGDGDPAAAAASELGDLTRSKACADGLDALELLLLDGDVELLLERHDQLDQVEAVGVEVVGEAGLGVTWSGSSTESTSTAHFGTAAREERASPTSPAFEAA
jgi:hypothetical protein